MEEMTNQELADCLRDGGGCQHEALARLLEADAKNHDLVAAQESKWRDALVGLVLALEYLQTAAYRTGKTDLTAYDRIDKALKTARDAIREGEMALPPETINQPVSKEEAELLNQEQPT